MQTWVRNVMYADPQHCPLDINILASHKNQALIVCRKVDPDRYRGNTFPPQS